jgi:predicted DNA-binding transcriptional regulator YafY
VKTQTRVGENESDGGLREPRLIRLWILAFTIANQRAGQTYEQLRRALDEEGFTVCKRTLQRDLRALRLSGFPVEKCVLSDGSVRWKVRAGAEIRLPLPLGLREIMALAVARRALALTDMAWLGSDLDSLCRRLLLGHSPDFEKLFDYVGRSLLVQTTQENRPPLSKGFHDTLLQAISSRRKVRLTYRNSNGSRSVRVTAPLSLFVARGITYLRAFCELRKMKCNFRLSRIEKIELLRETFPEELFEGVEQDVQSALGAFHAEAQKVVLEADAMLTAYLEENQLHSSQEIRREKNRNVVELNVGVNETLVHQLLGFGPHVRVLEPGYLAALLIERHRAALEFQEKRPPAQEGQLALPLHFEE